MIRYDPNIDQKVAPNLAPERPKRRHESDMEADSGKSDVGAFAFAAFLLVKTSHGIIGKMQSCRPIFRKSYFLPHKTGDISDNPLRTFNI